MSDKPNIPHINDEGEVMKLFMAATTEYARFVIDKGFVGVPHTLYDPDELDAARAKTPEGQFTVPPEPIEVVEYCEFRDLPSSGLIFSRTTEIDVDVDVDENGDLNMTISGGPTLADDPGDFTLSIEVPDEFALKREAIEDPPIGWPFREFWLTVEEANSYRHTLRVFDSIDGEEIRPDLVGK